MCSRFLGERKNLHTIFSLLGIFLLFKKNYSFKKEEKKNDIKFAEHNKINE